MNYYGQLDARWKNEKLGFSKAKDGTIGNKGCAITALANLYNHVTGSNLTPSRINALLKENNGYIQRDGYSIVNWIQAAKIFKTLKFVSRDWNYSNPLIWAWINVNPRLPVIVVSNISTQTPQHFYLFIGNRKMVDSLDGKVKPTSTYPTLLGSVRFTRT